MADYAYQGGNAPSNHSYHVTDGPRLASMANWVGALISLALIAGVCVWGYQLVMRDVTGIPVIEAAEGPMRVAPENPGGRAAEHQGLAVNRVAGEGHAAPPPEQIVLAPRPVDLTDEDIPVGEALKAPSFTRSEAGQVQLAVLRDEVEAEPIPAAEMDVPLTVQELADQIAANLTPLTPLEPATATPVETELGTVAAAATGPGLPRSLRPKSRPTGTQSASLTPVLQESSLARATAEEIPAAQVPSGERLVQLGAFDSPEVARSEWVRLSGRFGDYLDDKSRVVQKASSGGRTFYRLRAMGFADLSDARRFCAALVAQNADCIPVVAK